MKKNIGKILAVILVVALLATVLCACVPSDPAKAKENLKKNGYTITPDISGILDLGESFGINTKYEEVVVATNGDEKVSIVYFKTTDDAKSYLKELKNNRKESKEEIKKAKDEGKIDDAKYKELMKDFNNYKCGRNGKAVYAGTKAGVKACN